MTKTNCPSLLRFTLSKFSDGRKWDPDHTPTGHKCERRAIQLGLRGETLEAYGKREALEIINVSDFVAKQRGKIAKWKSGDLLTPAEETYVPTDQSIAKHIGLE